MVYAGTKMIKDQEDLHGGSFVLQNMFILEMTSWWGAADDLNSVSMLPYKTRIQNEAYHSAAFSAANLALVGVP